LTSVVEFIKPVGALSTKSAPQQVNILGWYLHVVKEQEHFTTAQIGACFDAAHVARPANIASTLAKLVASKAVLRSSSGFRLSASSRTAMEKVLPKRPTTVVTTAILDGLLVKVTNPIQKTFLHETLVCYKHGAYRAAVIMAWNLVYSDVLDRILTHHLAQFNKGVGTNNLKTAITRREDFENFSVKESEIIRIGRATGVLGKETTKALEEKLGKRNTAAHPSNIVVNEATANEVIFDLVQNVLLKPVL
jgi:hypothetical protein